MSALAVREPRDALRVMALCVAAYAAVALLTAARVFSGEPLEAADGWFYIDALSAYHLALMAAVFAASTAFGMAYFRREIEAGKLPRKLARRLGALWAAALAAMTLVFISNNLGVMWVGVEFTTLSTAFLIRLHVSRESLEATWKYLVICSVGVALAFLGVVMLAASARGVIADGQDATMWRSLLAAASNLDPGLARGAFLFVLVGFGTKAGLAPMHAWLPDAHSQAPSPVSAIFSGSLLNAALYCIMRYLPIVEGATGRSGWASGLLVAFGVGSVLLAAAFIVFQRDAKRLLAYSSVEHIGIIAIGMGLGPAGAFAALFHAFNHSASKAAAFFAAGRLGQALGSHDLSRMQGAARLSPLWGGALVVSLFSLVGVAPFAVFVSEFLVIQAAAAQGAWLALGLLTLGLGIVFAGAMRHVIPLGWGDSVGAQPQVDRARASEVAAVVVPLVAVALFGLFLPPAVRSAIEQAAHALGGGP